MQIYHWGRRDDKAKASISFQVWPWETGGKSLNRKCLIQSVFKMRNSSLSMHNEAKLLLQLKKALDWGPWVCGTLVPWPCPRLDLPALLVTQDRCGRLITACVNTEPRGGFRILPNGAFWAAAAVSRNWKE